MKGKTGRCFLLLYVEIRLCIAFICATLNTYTLFHVKNQVLLLEKTVKFAAAEAALMQSQNITVGIISSSHCAVLFYVYTPWSPWGKWQIGCCVYSLLRVLDFMQTFSREE